MVPHGSIHATIFGGIWRHVRVSCAFPYMILFLVVVPFIREHTQWCHVRVYGNHGCHIWFHPWHIYDNMVRFMAHLHTPFKNVIFTVGVKSIAKMCFPCCMGSMKKCASHGAWEAHFRLLRPLCNKTLTFFWHYYRRGVQKIENRILTEHEKQKKKCFSRSMGNIFLNFATPLD